MIDERGVPGVDAPLSFVVSPFVERVEDPSTDVLKKLFQKAQLSKEPFLSYIYPQSVDYVDKK